MPRCRADGRGAKNRIRGQAASSPSMYFAQISALYLGVRHDDERAGGPWLLANDPDGHVLMHSIYL